MVVITVSIGINPIIGLKSRECKIEAEGVNNVIAFKNIWKSFFLSNADINMRLSREICSTDFTVTAWSSSSKRSSRHNRMFSKISNRFISKFRTLICSIVFLRTGTSCSILDGQYDAWRVKSGAQRCPETEAKKICSY